MSHFIVGVIVPGDTPPSGIEEAVTSLLAPFDENIEVPEYDDVCICVGSVAHKEAREHANNTVGSIEQLRDRFDTEVRTPYFDKLKAEGKDEKDIAFSDEVADYFQSRWEEFLAPYEKAQNDFFNTHPMRDKPDPTCGFYTGERKDWWPKDAKEGDHYCDGSGCRGTGTVKSTYNPKSKWDWHVIGGRWNGYITGTPSNMYGGELSKNIIPVQDLLTHELAIKETGDKKNSRIPFAIVTPDGKWHEKGHMGWWAVVSDKNPDWDNVALDILKNNVDHILVAVDCHI